ncbi:MAG: hypothetical protein Q9217_003808 [Psora testacea]
MLIEGEKYACEACVRGHRVSTCQHTDRPLTHINKKGRPVSQCPHCRGLRKARASHVACECGAKPHSKEECSEEKTSDDSTSDPGSEHTCCCTHGARCTCALKKEHTLDPVPEVDLPVTSPTRRTSSKKPRLAKAGSDNSLTVFANGHHKPMHKHNDSAHQCGMPYKIPIPHSVNGNADVARRSVDSLPVLKRKEEPHAESISQPDLTSPKQKEEPSTELISQPDLRHSKSEHGSPLPRQGRDQLPPLDFTYPPSESSPSDDHFRSPFYTPQEDRPGLSPGLSMIPSADWAAFDLPADGFSTAYSQPPSYTSYDRAGLTTSSSGELSDVGDYISHSQEKLFRPDFVTAGSEERKLNRLSSSSYTSVPKSIPPPDFDNYLRPATASPSEVEVPSSGMNLGSEAFEKHGFTVHDAQKMAHPETPTEAIIGLKIPRAQDENKPIWAGTYSPSETSFVSQKEVENNSWQR